MFAYYNHQPKHTAHFLNSEIVILFGQIMYIEVAVCGSDKEIIDSDAT